MFLSGLKPDRPVRVSGTALFLPSDVDKVPASLLHNLKHNKVLHERVVLLSIKTLDIPRVPDDQRLEIRDVGHDFYTVVTRYGFVEEPDIWRVLAQCQAQDLRFNLMETSVFVGREKLVISDHTPLMRWRKELFLLLFRLSVIAVLSQVHDTECEVVSPDGVLTAKANSTEPEGRRVTREALRNASRPSADSVEIHSIQPCGRSGEDR
jgi:K+ transporter